MQKHRKFLLYINNSRAKPPATLGRIAKAMLDCGKGTVDILILMTIRYVSISEEQKKGCS